MHILSYEILSYEYRILNAKHGIPLSVVSNCARCIKGIKNANLNDNRYIVLIHENGDPTKKSFLGKHNDKDYVYYSRVSDGVRLFRKKQAERILRSFMSESRSNKSEFTASIHRWKDIKDYLSIPSYDSSYSDYKNAMTQLTQTQRNKILNKYSTHKF